jgi:hypothetical protein
MLADSTLQILNQYAHFCERAICFEGRPRERMVALGEADELYFRLYPHHYRALQIVRVAAQLGREVNTRREFLQRCESRTVRMITLVVHDAIVCGDLSLLTPQRPEELAFSVWAMVFWCASLDEYARREAAARYPGRLCPGP